MIIDVFSDVACPWCYIGERRLVKAVAMRPDLDVEMRWRLYQLRPELPKEGIAWGDFVREKWGSMERAAGIFQRVTQIGATEGIKFDFVYMARNPNTVDAQRLILFAREHGKEWQMAEALFAAHFTDGRNVSDHATLAEIAAEIGLNKEEAAAYLRSEAGVAEMDSSQQVAYMNGIQAVPCYIIDNRYMINGAASLDDFLSVLDEAVAVA